MILLDTDVLIDLVKGKIDPPSEPLAITTITLYEFLRGAKDVDKAAEILSRDFVILTESEESVILAARIWKDLRSKGELVHDADILIASISIVHNLPLWTRNRRHYKRFLDYGLKLYSP